MLTRYILHTENEDYTLREDDLRNWEAIRCSRTRSDFGGVTRSYTSQFEFVNKARRLLRDLFLSQGFGAEASVCVETQTNSWTYERRFSCQLDFSTIQWEDDVLKINAVDNSIAALIKANKSTKYEYAVGTDIKPDASVRYDRIPMLESASYEFTQGETSDDDGDITVRFTRDQQPWVGNVGSETAINRSVYWNEDQEDTATGFLIRAEKDVEITFEYDVDWRIDAGSANQAGLTQLGLRIRRNGVLVPLSDSQTGNFCDVWKRKYNMKAAVSSASSLPPCDETATSPYDYALVDGIVYTPHYNGAKYNYWVNTGKPIEEHFRERKSGTMTFQMNAGDRLVLIHTLTEPNIPGYLDIRFAGSLFRFSWKGIGDPVDIDSFTPGRVLDSIVKSVTGRSDIKTFISNRDTRLAGTYLMAAEKIRGIEGAKLYTSFNEFCDWMSAVFGYVHTIGSGVLYPVEPVVECGGYTNTVYSFVESHIGRNVSTDDIWYFAPLGRFFALDTATGMYYALWPGHENYNADGHARTDVIFRIKGFNPTELCRIGAMQGGFYYPTLLGYTEEEMGKELDIITFLHRSELFKPDSPVLRFENIDDTKFSIDTGVIYSSVTAGYDRKEYNSVNGRDEFNFSNTYSTGSTAGDKTLSLASKYRADSYGIEFAAQKRDQQTTDSASDKDVFFMLCQLSGKTLLPDRTAVVEGSMSDRVFNAAFSPMACVRANAGLIGLQSSVVNLKFTSSTGNSAIVIDDEPMTADMTLDAPLATCGVLEFSMPDVIPEGNEDNIVSVSSGGLTYRGYLREADVNYARAETTKCKLIVKEILS